MVAVLLCLVYVGHVDGYFYGKAIICSPGWPEAVQQLQSCHGMQFICILDTDTCTFDKTCAHAPTQDGSIFKELHKGRLSLVGFVRCGLHAEIAYSMIQYGTFCMQEHTKKSDLNCITSESSGGHPSFWHHRIAHAIVQTGFDE